MESIGSVLLFWFGDSQIDAEVCNQKKALWWSKKDQVDQEIFDRFQPFTNQISKGNLGHWQDTANGLLASIVCLDQFPRNMYRGLPQSFAYDNQALQLARIMVENSWDREILPINCVFAYIPFEHSESLSDQKTSLGLYETLRDSVALEDKPIFDGFYQFAVKHYEIIEKFNRFPHRNQILGRESTEQELEFLSQPGSSF